MVVALFVLVGLAVLAAGLIPEYRLPFRHARPPGARGGGHTARHLRKAS